MEMYIKYILLPTSGMKISLWPEATIFEKSHNHKLIRFSRFYDFYNVVALGHN